MATLDEILAEQAKFVSTAKEMSERTHITPPKEDASLASKEALVKDLQARTASLTGARNGITAQLNQQIASYKDEIEGLQKQIEEEKQAGGNR